MNVIETTDELAAFCSRIASATYITVDTEFMRESTFWPRLCLVQVAGPDEAWCIDPMAPGIKLDPLFALLRDPNIRKVFHAARQDLEIFYQLMGEVPAPLFDTQVAAMVCGFGEQVGYETLVSQLANANVDKSSRFTDWSKRPLTERQLTYALCDVTYLRTIYDKLEARLLKSGREAWLVAEMAILADPKTYNLDPADAWKRLKSRSTNARFIAVLKEVAAWREHESRNRDVPRNRIVRDEALLDLAGEAPTTVEQLLRIRGLSRGLAEGKSGEVLLAAIGRAKALPPEQLPPVEREQPLPKGIGPLVELLKVLLKLKCEENDVAQKLVASSSDLDLIAADDNAKVPALQGWRREIFGNDALALKQGRLGLAANGRQIRLMRLDAKGAAAD